MKLVHAKMIRTQVVDKTYDGKASRSYQFTCQETDLDGSLIPFVINTSNADAAKVLEIYLKDGEFRLVPIKSISVNEYNEGKNTLKLADDSVLHPDFHETFYSVALSL